MQLSKPYDFTLALTIALSAHADQVDKGGEPYILHPVRVASKMRTPRQRCLAVLHDVLEDAEGEKLVSVTADILSRFGEEFFELLEGLTRGEEQYDSYIERVVRVEELVPIKLADVEDNLDRERWARCGFTPPRCLQLRYERARYDLRRAAIYWEAGEEDRDLCKSRGLKGADSKDPTVIRS